MTRYGLRTYSRVDDLLDDVEVGMVCIRTPHPMHAATAIRGRSRPACLVEKPMATRLADCDAMIRAAVANGVKLGVVSQRRFYEPMIRMRQAVVEHRIGQPALGILMVLGWRGDDYYSLDPWRGTWAGEGGGVLVTQATHHLDLFQWLMGPVVELVGYWANLNHPSIEVEDTAVAILRFANGALGSIVASDSQKPGLFGRIDIRGTTGASLGVQLEIGSSFVSGVTREVTPLFNDLWTIAGEESVLATWREDDTSRGATIDIMDEYHRRQIEDFLAAVTDHRPPAVFGEERRKSVELFTAIYRPNRDQVPVRFPLVSERERR